MSENLTAAIVVATCAFAFAWAVWVIAVNIRRSRSSRQTADLQSRLLDRFPGSQELTAFLEGDAGRRYLKALESDLRDPLNRILNGIQAGIVILLVGLSLVAVRVSQRDDDTRKVLLLLGAPAMAIGAGFLISAAISHRLCKSWGLLEKNHRQSP